MAKILSGRRAVCVTPSWVGRLSMRCSLLLQLRNTSGWAGRLGSGEPRIYQPGAQGRCRCLEEKSDPNRARTA